MGQLLEPTPDQYGEMDSATMILIDSHCHLSDPRLLSQVDQLLHEARNVGVATVISPSVSVEDAVKVVELTEKFAVYGLAGIHPENVNTVENLADSVERIKTLSSNKRIVGIGEIGLDFYRDETKETECKQLELCGRQLQLALDLAKPAVIHMRAADEEMRTLLKSFRELPKGQFHCFAGSRKFLEEVLALGFDVSFCGNITYKSAGDLHDLFLATPLDRVHLETDSPYLSPEGKRGQVNTPANVKITAEFMAGLRHLSSSELAEQTTANTCRLFGIDIHELNPSLNSQTPQV